MNKEDGLVTAHTSDVKETSGSQGMHEWLPLLFSELSLCCILKGLASVMVLLQPLLEIHSCWIYDDHHHLGIGISQNCMPFCLCKGCKPML